MTAAARARAVRITKAGIPGPRHWLEDADRTWKWYREGRTRFIGRLGTADGKHTRAVIAWCPFCDYDGTEVAARPQGTYGERLDAAIGAHLDGCAGFAAWVPLAAELGLAA